MSSFIHLSHRLADESRFVLVPDGNLDWLNIALKMFWVILVVLILRDIGHFGSCYRLKIRASFLLARIFDQALTTDLRFDGRI